ncbi:sigma factor-like helix-turn-helix DNA-binding protein [Streptomyces sp. bgisy034]|uniref:sigma factor-like helix-turn-helix DNA-binding protein n=1 Tax=Streptomyces sp. bgisy034 TaxID=3413774 RepID=UPI003EBCFA74
MAPPPSCPPSRHNAWLDFLRRHNRRPSTHEPVPGMGCGDGPRPRACPGCRPSPTTSCPTPPPLTSRKTPTRRRGRASETLELVFLTAIQQFPPRQRAAVIPRDMAGWTAQETAEPLDTSVASANSAVQRGRSALRQTLPERRED